MATFKTDKIKLEKQTIKQMFQLFANGDPNEIEKFISINKVDLSIQDPQGGRYLIHSCISHTDSACAQILLKYNRSLIEKRDNDGFTALHLATMLGNKDMVSFLLDNGACPDTVDFQGHSSLHWAVICCQVELVDLLFRQRATIGLADSYGAHPIHYAMRIFLNKETRDLASQILNRFLDNGAPVDCSDFEGRTPLFWAASLGLVECCERLLKAGSSFTHRDKDGLTVLHSAASKGQTDVVNFILERTTLTVDIMERNGCTPLFYAVTFNHLDTVKCLLARGASPNHQDINGFSPAHCAAVKGNAKAIQLIMEAGGSPWIKNHNMDTALHEACESASFDIVKCLIEIAKESNKEDILNETNANGYNALHLSALSGASDVCKLLKDHGVDVNISVPIGGGNFGGLTALDLTNDSECQTIIQKNGGQHGFLEDIAEATTDSETSDTKLGRKHKANKIRHNKRKSKDTIDSVEHRVLNVPKFQIKPKTKGLENISQVPMEKNSSNSNTTKNRSTTKTNTLREQYGTKYFNLDKKLKPKFHVRQNDLIKDKQQFSSNYILENDCCSLEDTEQETKNVYHSKNRRYVYPIKKNMEVSTHLSLEIDSHQQYISYTYLPTRPKTPKKTIPQTVLEFEGLRLASRDLARQKLSELLMDHSTLQEFAVTAQTESNKNKLFDIQQNKAKYTSRKRKDNSDTTSSSLHLGSSISTKPFVLDGVSFRPVNQSYRYSNIDVTRYSNSNVKKKIRPKIPQKEVVRIEKLKKAYAPLIPNIDFLE